MSSSLRDSGDFCGLGAKAGCFCSRRREGKAGRLTYGKAKRLFQIQELNASYLAILQLLNSCNSCNS